MTALVSELRNKRSKPAVLINFQSLATEMSHKTRLRTAADSAKECQNFCNTCMLEIPDDEIDFHCFSCSVIYHLIKCCTALSAAALVGINELGITALLLGNNCVAMKQRDRIIETASKRQQPKEYKQLKTLQTEVSEVKTAISEMKTVLDKNGHASNLPASISKESTLQQKFKQEQKSPEGIRVRCLPESTSKVARERNEHDMREVSK